MKMYCGTNPQDGKLIIDSDLKNPKDKQFEASATYLGLCKNMCGNKRRECSAYCQECSDKFNKEKTI